MLCGKLGWNKAKKAFCQLEDSSLSEWHHGLKWRSPVITLQFSSVQSLSRVWLLEAPWIAAHQASLSITNSRSLHKLMFIKSVMPSSHLILGHPLLLLPPIPPSIRVFSNESTLRMRWPKYWSFSFSIISIFGACEYATLHAQGCRYNCLSDDPAIGLFWMRKEEEAESEKKVKRLHCWLWRWRKKTQTKKWQWSLGTGKGKKSFSPPPEPPERNSALQTPQFYPSETHLGLWTTRNRCYSSNGKKNTHSRLLCIWVFAQVMPLLKSTMLGPVMVPH